MFRQTSKSTPQKEETVQISFWLDQVNTFTRCLEPESGILTDQTRTKKQAAETTAAAAAGTWRNSLRSNSNVTGEQRQLDSCRCFRTYFVNWRKRHLKLLKGVFFFQRNLKWTTQQFSPFFYTPRSSLTNFKRCDLKVGRIFCRISTTRK